MRAGAVAERAGLVAAAELAPGVARADAESLSYMSSLAVRGRLFKHSVRASCSVCVFAKP